MGQGKGWVFEEGSPELLCLNQLRSDGWNEQDWHDIFARQIHDDDNGSDEEETTVSESKNRDESNFLPPEETARFFQKIFKFLELPGNVGQFVASLMARLDVEQQGQLSWQSILQL